MSDVVQPFETITCPHCGYWQLDLRGVHYDSAICRKCACEVTGMELNEAVYQQTREAEFHSKLP